MFKSTVHEVAVGISARQWTGDGARFRVDRELNALQNGDIADLQGKITDERRGACRVPGDCNCGIICITGAGDLREQRGQGTDDN